MVAMQLSEAARVVGGRMCGPDVAFQGVYTDSRAPRSGALFVALRGPNFDGKAYLPEVARQGAAAALVDEERAGGLPCVQVDDTRQALTRLARHWRARFRPDLVAVTGSNGKTTVKEMLSVLLAGRGPVLATQGNLNNDLGVPLTLLRLRSEHRSAVIEMGANHRGEIADLVALAQPGVALITNAGRAHLEGFGSLEGVARAKGEILSGLGDGGVAVIPADTPFSGLWQGLAAPHRVVSFGFDVPAQVRGDGASVTVRWEGEGFLSHCQVDLEGRGLVLRLRLAGRHNLRNALAALAAGHALGLDAQAMLMALEGLSPVVGRLSPLPGKQGMRLIDDTYNANPDSLQAALNLLGQLAGESWVALGDMGELGEGAAELHQAMGRRMAEVGVSRLFATGPLARETVRAFGPGAEHFPAAAALAEAVDAQARAGVTLLVKGSRAQHMERVVHALSAVGRP